ncbi:Protein of unknown function [Nitrosomonas cryotolerans]|uniref:DUF2959 domain-containing protein n=1 Tax=Nitrosomonas cryotolerans ATCC 49181 TaxID=1131553 RepID=A0A1N6H9G9_9PROT|nr:DUF2959 domain-containing protein [Nitrosomonas cryotolerans]SFP80165.1 Protein of unknown function [Nitrosomonas cryotolerans]SIO16444.1 Protein of unknown function [Nitrosomonas cryotolerans ATCC 49181]
MYFLQRLFIFSFVSSLLACSSVQYGILEKVGIPKRDVMVYRVEKARDTQEETKAQFKSALAQFTAVTNFKGGDLETIYNQLNSEYEASVSKAQEVSKRIADIEDIAQALFSEWEQEITQYNNISLKHSSQNKLNATKTHYRQLLSLMKSAETKIKPVLRVFSDHVLFLKHNLNARAIASLKGELGIMKADVSSLITSMEKSIHEANAFINTMEK